MKANKSQRSRGCALARGFWAVGRRNPLELNRLLRQGYSNRIGLPREGEDLRGDHVIANPSLIGCVQSN
jgi:hypothetical protein